MASLHEEPFLNPRNFLADAVCVNDLSQGDADFRVLRSCSGCCLRLRGQRTLRLAHSISPRCRTQYDRSSEKDLPGQGNYTILDMIEVYMDLDEYIGGLSTMFELFDTTRITPENFRRTMGDRQSAPTVHKVIQGARN